MISLHTEVTSLAKATGYALALRGSEKKLWKVEGRGPNYFLMWKRRSLKSMFPSNAAFLILLLLLFFFSPVRACLLLLCFFLLLLFSVLPLFAPSLLLCPPLFHLPVFTSSQWFARKCFFIETKKESAYTSLAACRGNALVQKQN